MPRGPFLEWGAGRERQRRRGAFRTSGGDLAHQWHEELLHLGRAAVLDPTGQVLEARRAGRRLLGTHLGRDHHCGHGAGTGRHDAVTAREGWSAASGWDGVEWGGGNHRGRVNSWMDQFNCGIQAGTAIQFPYRVITYTAYVLSRISFLDYQGSLKCDVF